MHRRGYVLLFWRLYSAIFYSILLYLSDNLDMRVREGRGLKGGAAASPFFFFFLLKLNINAAWIKGVGLKVG